MMNEAEEVARVAVAKEVSIADLQPLSPKPKPKTNKKSTRRVSLADWLESWEGDFDQLYMAARELCYVQHKRPEVLVDAMDALRSQARHQRQGIAAGRVTSLPPDPQVAIARVKRLADEAAIARLDRERELRDLTIEAAKCRHALQDKDFKLAAEARRQLAELNEHTLEEARIALRKAKEHEELTQLNYRSIRGDKFPAPGAASWGSCEK